MSTNVTWANGVTYAIPASGEVNWPSLSNFLIALGNSAAISTVMKQAVRVATTTPITVSNSSDCTVLAKLAAPGAVAVTLPAGVDGRVFIVGDQTGDAGTNNITITPNGAETINGSATYVINDNRGSVMLQYSTTNTRWNVVARFINGTVAVNPLTTNGDIIYGVGTTPTRLAAGASVNTVLHSGTSGGTAPSWSQIVDADVSASAAIAGSKLAIAFNGSGTGTAILSGTYLPVASGAVGCTPVMYNCQYMQVGKVVTVAGTFDSPTTANPANFEMTLPVAANFTGTIRTLGGSGGAGDAAATGETIRIYANSNATGRAYLGWNTVTTTNRTFTFTFTYSIP